MAKGAAAAYTISGGTPKVDRIDGGWNTWKSYTECASGCLYGEEGRLRSGSTGIMVATRSCSNPK